MSLEFWVVDFGSFWDIQILHQKLLLIQYLQLLHYINFSDVSPVNHTHTPPDFVDKLEGGQAIQKGSLRQDNAQNVMLPLPTHKQNNRYPKNAEPVRSVLADYFYGPGQVPWQ